MYLVGAPLKILAAYSTAIIECQCAAKTVIPLHGKGLVRRCPACGHAFAISESGVISVGHVVGGLPDEAPNLA